MLDERTRRQLSNGSVDALEAGVATQHGHGFKQGWGVLSSTDRYTNGLKHLAGLDS